MMDIIKMCRSNSVTFPVMSDVNGLLGCLTEEPNSTVSTCLCLKQNKTDTDILQSPFSLNTNNQTKYKQTNKAVFKTNYTQTIMMLSRQTTHKRKCIRFDQPKLDVSK